MNKLYVVATPIGNLEDITLRALRVLKEVDVIFAEDTRHTRKLLSHYDIHTKLERLDAHTEAENASRVIDALGDGRNVAYVTDAGTPGISDPGTLLASRVRGAGFSVVVVPGPSALTAALSVAGIPSHEFVFLGFLPHKKGRSALFERIAQEQSTVVFYESPHRIMKTLQALSEVFSNSHELENKSRQVVLARELTKVHEEILSGTAEGLLEILETTPEKQRGEFVVIVSST